MDGGKDTGARGAGAGAGAAAAADAATDAVVAVAPEVVDGAAAGAVELWLVEAEVGTGAAVVVVGGAEAAARGPVDAAWAPAPEATAGVPRGAAASAWAFLWGVAMAAAAVGVGPVAPGVAAADTGVELELLWSEEGGACPGPRGPAVAGAGPAPGPVAPGPVAGLAPLTMWAMDRGWACLGAAAAVAVAAGAGAGTPRGAPGPAAAAVTTAAAV